MRSATATPTPPKTAPERTGWRPPIAWQLGIGFLGVAVLAAVANFAVQKTITISSMQIVEAPPEVKLWVPPAPASDAVAAKPDTRTGAAALPALERLGDAVYAPLQMEPAERLRRAQGAAAEVKATLADLHGHAAGGAADVALRSARRLIEQSAARSELYAGYSAALAGVDTELQAGLNKAWKIMGRVVARQSLVAMNNTFDEVQRQAETLREPGYLPLEADRLQELEARFSEALSDGARGLRKGETRGDAPPVLQHFEEATQASARLIRGDKERIVAMDRFREQLEGLRKRLLATATVERLYPATVTPEANAMEQLAAKENIAPIASAAEWRHGDPVTTRDVDPASISEGALRWLSGGVLALLLAVSVLIVLSILRPVHRLIRATHRIAQGEGGVRVQRGGASELDRLGSAFNLMAEKLEAAQSVARTYQQQLEFRVEERTRQLQHTADHDALTQLPNRRQLFDKLRESLVRAEAARGQAGVFFIDLDNFKNINDGLGHGFGDRVLVAIAERISQTLGGRGVAARFGGDEFTVIAECSDGTQALRDLGWSLVRAFHEPLRLDGRELLVSVSVGAAFYPEHSADAESLLRAADAALFRAKALGRSQLAEFTPDLLEAAASRFAIEQGLRQALDRGELQLVFQPELDISTLEVEVAEALLRWRHPDGRLLGPGEFLHVAEESGLIIEINDWVVRSAIAAAARWHARGFDRLRVAVNVSARQLTDLSFPERVRELLQEYGLPPSLLEIELTETVLQTGASTVDALRRLQQLGVAVALDDFGTGYSTLASLECLPLDRVKLDRSLIAGIDSSARSASIANAIIGLCRDLGVRITAEGIERNTQLARLRGEGVLVQGYLLTAALTEERLMESMQTLPRLLQSLLLEAPPVLLPQSASRSESNARNESNVRSIGDTQRRRRLIDASAMGG